MNTQININKTENPDSIELGSASKDAKIKVYGDFSDDKNFKDKIDKAIMLKKYALEKHKEILG